MRGSNGRLRMGIAGIGVAAVLLAGCAKSSTGASSGGSSPSTSGGASIQTESVSGIGTVLANAAGLTLYHNTKEKNGVIACTGSCTSVWPPVAATGSLPKATGTMNGTFGTIKRPDGTTQLTYAGMPLYTFSGDTAAGQAHGQGIEGIWFAMNASGTTSSPSSSGGGRYGSGSGGSGSGGYGGYGS
jgi:predicted lipoprotein with Yx(FWY)xxD motif